MCSTDDSCDQKQGLDDSGCVQGGDPMNSNSRRVRLLDFSDDVLLYILRHCTPRDLKALGFSCARLGRLVRERSLWRRVDARSEPCSRARLKWFVENALHSDTQVLMLRGYAKDSEGCIGLINLNRKEAEQERKYHEQRTELLNNGHTTVCEAIHEIPLPMDRLERHPARFFISAQRTQLPRHRCFPTWPLDGDRGRSGPHTCTGPKFTLSQDLLELLTGKCPQLTVLGLEYCNIDCSDTLLGSFPRTLKKLSLRGTKCYNMTYDKSFLFKIQDYLPLIESLDVSECEWMDPATLLPLSKMHKLEELIMQDCYKLAEFVAYASLTARYGFRVLKSLDLRGSPVGDSEVSALGWLPQLERLWLSARRRERAQPHAHYVDDERVEHEQLHDWESAMPDVSPDTSLDDMNTSDEFTDSLEERPRSKKSQPREDERDYKRKLDEGNEEGRKGDVDGEPLCKRRRSIEQNTEDIKEDKNIENIGSSSSDKRCEFQFNEDYNKINENKKSVNEEKPKDIDDSLNQSLSNSLYEPDSLEVSIDSNRQTDDSQDNNDPINDTDGNGENRDKRFHPDGRCPTPDCIVDCIKIDQLIDVSDSRCGRQNEVIVIASSSRPKHHRPSTSQPNADNKSQGYVHFRQNQHPVYVNIDNDDVPNENSEPDNGNDETKKENKTDDDNENQDKDKPGTSGDPVNEGASTSKDNDKSDKQKYVMFGKHKVPVQVQRRDPLPPVQYQIEPRHHVLYVGVGPQLNTYRFPRDSSELIRHLNFRPSHVDSSSLVTDFAIRRFGRADGEDVNIIHIGPNGPMVVGQASGSRPDRSSLRFLSVTGYRNITDRSLVHLATAAPNLTHIDFSGTSVTENGAESFKSLRPECEVIFSPFDKEEK